MKKTILLLSALFLFSCSTQNKTETKVPVETKKTTTTAPTKETETATQIDFSKKIQECMCIKIYMPVCGDDKMTYGNSCMAECAGVKYKPGKCGEFK